MALPYEEAPFVLFYLLQSLILEWLLLDNYSLPHSACAKIRGFGVIHSRRVYCHSLQSNLVSCMLPLLLALEVWILVDGLPFSF